MSGIYGKYSYYYTPFSCDTTPGRKGFCRFQKTSPFVRCIWAPLVKGQVAFSIINLFPGVYYFVIKICLGLKYGIESLSSAPHSFKKCIRIG